jgi:adenine-specific DNA glycosylase
VGETLAEIRHTVTRFRITLCCYTAEWVAGEIARSGSDHRWLAIEHLERLPMPVTGRKIARLLQARSKNRLSGRSTARLP